MTKQELLEKRKQIKQQIWDVEQILKNKTYVSSVDFASMYPGIIRLLNASIENMVGFLNNDPISNRRLGLSKTVKDAALKSKEIVQGEIRDSKYVKFVGKKEDKVSLRKDLYDGKFADAEIDEIAETPFEQYFLAIMFGNEDKTFTFQDKTFTAQELQKYFKENNLSLSGSGAIFNNYFMDKDDENRQGLIPSYLEYLFKQRKIVKKEMFKHYKRKILLQKFRQAAIDDGVYS